MDEDEAWLYGDAEKKDDNNKDKGEGGAAPAGTEDIADVDNQEDKEAGEVSGEENEGTDAAGNEATGDDDDDDDDDDSDDDIQVTIGDIKTQTSYEKTSFKYQRGGAQIKSAPVKGVDVEAVGTINGVPLFEYDINSLQPDEKPWRKPGADITDYFNYGFTEDTWIKYCEKQKRMRTEAGVGGVFTIHHPPNVKTINTRPNTTIIVTGDPKTPEVIGAVSPGNKKAGPPPGRKMSGTIDVIGTSVQTTRRVKSDFETGDPNDFAKKFPGGLPPGVMPNTSQPPPPVSVPPAGFGVPPPIMAGPHMGLPPPGMPGPPPGMPPPGAPVGYPIPQPGFFPPPGMPPPDSRGPPPGFGFDGFNVGPPPGFGGPPPNSGPPPPWENRPPGFNPGWSDFGGGRSPRRSDSELSGSDEERRGSRYRRTERDTFDRGYRDEREFYERRSRSRDRDRERRHRDREGDRSREPDRDRSREKDRGDRDRDRDRERDREERDRHRSSRRKHDDEDYHRSKHKKSKRSRKDKEDEGEGTNAPTSQEGEGGSSQ